MQQYLWYFLITLVLIVLQTTLIPFIAIADSIPDILLIWIVYIALQKGQITGGVCGFVIGLVFDLLSTQFIGLSALSKTVAGFVAGYFHNKNKVDITIADYQLLSILSFISFLHNIIYFTLFIKDAEITFVTGIVRFVVFSTVYTTVVSLFPFFLFSKKRIRYE